MTTYAQDFDRNVELRANTSGRVPLSDWIWSTVFASIVMGWALFNPAMQNWIAIPIFACGVLTAVDAVAWIRRRVDIFDPIGVLGFLGVHFFFLAPIFHIVWNTWS